MIAETLIISVTAITCSSLYVSNAICKRLHLQGHPPKPKVKILPFSNPVNNACRLCGVDYNTISDKLTATFCTDEKCPAYPHTHLDIYCPACKGKYFKKPTKHYTAV